MFLWLVLVASVSLPLGRVVDAPGRYCAEGSDSCVTLSSEEGESLCLTVPGSRTRPKHGCDITGLAWLNKDEVLFSTASIYGSPGIYRYKLRAAKEEAVVPSRTRDAAYPDGKDFFKLISISENEVTFWYCPDIEKLNESALETTAAKETLPLAKKKRP